MKRSPSFVQTFRKPTGSRRQRVQSLQNDFDRTGDGRLDRRRTFLPKIRYLQASIATSRIWSFSGRCASARRPNSRAVGQIHVVGRGAPLRGDAVGGEEMDRAGGAPVGSRRRRWPDRSRSSVPSAAARPSSPPRLPRPSDRPAAASVARRPAGRRCHRSPTDCQGRR